MASQVYHMNLEQYRDWARFFREELDEWLRSQGK